MFRNREDAGRQLADRLKACSLRNPLVLAIPRGGVITGAALARQLGAELDVILSRKIYAPTDPHFTVGAVSEDGMVYLAPHAGDVAGLTANYLGRQRHQELREIARLRRHYRGSRQPAAIAGRSVIVTDDGIATGATMIAALRTINEQKPYEVIAAVPMASPDRLAEVRRWCDEIIWLLKPELLVAISEFYEGFPPVKIGRAHV